MDRQAEDVSLFEIGHVFALPARPGDHSRRDRTAGGHRDAVAADGVRTAPIDRRGGGRGRPHLGRTWPTPSAWRTTPWPPAVVPGFHPTRAARLVGASGRQPSGAVGEVHPDVVAAYGLRRRVGYLTVSRGRAAGRAPPARDQPGTVSRFPASDIDLAFVVADTVPAAAVRTTLATAGRRPARVGLAVRRLPGPAPRRRPAQPGLPAAVPGPRPHPRRRRAGRSPPACHRGRGRCPRRRAAVLKSATVTWPEPTNRRSAPIPSAAGPGGGLELP